jgi:hypothetical protein
VNAFIHTDWRRLHQDAVRDAFPSLHEGEIRRVLILPIARARTPGEALAGVHGAAESLRMAGKLSSANDLKIAPIVAGLARMASQESAI